MQRSRDGAQHRANDRRRLSAFHLLDSVACRLQASAALELSATTQPKERNMSKTLMRIHKRGAPVLDEVVKGSEGAQQSPLVMRLLTPEEWDLVGGGEGSGYCQGIGGGGYTQNGGSYTQSGGTYSQAGGTYNMNCI